MFRHHHHHACGGHGRSQHFQQHFARFGDEMREHFGRGGWGKDFGGGFGRGAGGRERMFDSGEFQLILLHLIAEKPSYGYELIKSLEEKLAGGYAPSPGVIYPTLTLLEESGFATASTEGGRKIFTVTEQGQAHLAANKQRLDEILSRLERAKEGFDGARMSDAMHAFKDLQRALLGFGVRARVTGQKPSEEKVAQIKAILEAATRDINEI